MWVERNLSDSLMQGAVFEDPDGKMDGVVLFHEGEIRDGLGNVAGKRLFAFYIDNDAEMPKAIAPTFIWDLVECQKNMEGIDFEALKHQVMNHLIPVLDNYKAELAIERNRQTEIKRKYGIASLDHLILKLDGDLIQLYDRRERGENVDLVIYNKEEQKRQYEVSLEKLKHSIEQEQILTMSMPNLVGAIRVVPKQVEYADMVSSAAIEEIGMVAAMCYELDQNRTPEDVSAENLGFDIRSTDSSGKKRYIEVKARSNAGAVALTSNEWFKAKRFQDDYFLYVVLNAATKPELYIIQNPAEQAHAEEKIEVVRYLIPLSEIRAKPANEFAG